MAEIEAKIVAQGDKIRELKTAKAAKDVIQPEVIFVGLIHAFHPHERCQSIETNRWQHCSPSKRNTKRRQGKTGNLQQLLPRLLLPRQPVLPKK